MVPETPNLAALVAKIEASLEVALAATNQQQVAAPPPAGYGTYCLGIELPLAVMGTPDEERYINDGARDLARGIRENKAGPVDCEVTAELNEDRIVYVARFEV